MGHYGIYCEVRLTHIAHITIRISYVCIMVYSLAMTHPRAGEKMPKSALLFFYEKKGRNKKTFPGEGLCEAGGGRVGVL